MTAHAQNRRIALYVYRNFADDDRLSQMAECTPEAAKMAEVVTHMRIHWQHFLACGVFWGILIGFLYLMRGKP